MSAALRGRYAELKHVVWHRNLRRLLDDLSAQHGRHERELTVLLTDFGGRDQPVQRRGDGVSGDEHLIPPSLPFTISPDADSILGGVVAAEADMTSAYRIAVGGLDADSPLRSTLERHAVALQTILGRAEALRSLI
jgi:hypothetical protein